jgi:hypothetical protein
MNHLAELQKFMKEGYEVHVGHHMNGRWAVRDNYTEYIADSLELAIEAFLQGTHDQQEVRRKQRPTWKSIGYQQVG